MADHHFSRTRRDAALSPADRSDAREALALLSGSGLSLAAAARFALEGRSAIRRISVGDATELFLHEKLKRRGATFGFYESKLRGVCDVFGSKLMDEVSRADFRSWASALEVAETTRAGYVRAARALWRWAAAQEPPLAGPAPTLGMVASVSSDSTPRWLSVEQVRQLLAEASPWRPALALMLFAGVRVEEVAGTGKPAMSWRCIDKKARSIRVPAESAKVTGRARLVQGLPPTVWAWLVPGDDAAPICPGLAVSAIRWARSRVPGYPKNALRHTFATYAAAITGQPDKVAGWLGHEGGPRLVHSTYAGLARKAEAVEFFALRPR